MCKQIYRRLIFDENFDMLIQVPKTFGYCLTGIYGVNNAIPLPLDVNFVVKLTGFLIFNFPKATFHKHCVFTSNMTTECTGAYVKYYFDMLIQVPKTFGYCLTGIYGVNNAIPLPLDVNFVVKLTGFFIFNFPKATFHKHCVFTSNMTTECTGAYVK